MEIPAKWKAIMSLAQEIEPRAVLAGGALRDLDNGKPVKDLDIFVPSHSEAVFHQTVYAFSKVWDAPTVPYESFESYMTWHDRLMGVAEWELLGVPVQIIGLYLADVMWSPDGVINRVDMGICQIAWDGESFYKTPAYDVDKQTQTFTIVKRQTPNQLLRSVQRYLRLTEEKYAGWRFNIEHQDAEGFVVVDLWD